MRVSVEEMLPPDGIVIVCGLKLNVTPEGRPPVMYSDTGPE